MRHLLLVVATLTVMLSLTLSCDDHTCYDRQSSVPLAQFYNNGAKASLPGLSVRGLGAPNDSVLIDSSNVTDMYLPLPVNDTVASFRLWRYVTDEEGNKSIVDDTLSLTYRPIAYFASRECGAMYNYELHRVTVTSNMFDSVGVEQWLVSNLDVPSLILYLTQ